MINSPLKFDFALVRVMRSHDYCHFDVALGSSEATTPEQVDDLRKAAARLADKAVSQYRTAKIHANRVMSAAQTRHAESRRMDHIREKPEGDRTPNEQATLKAFDDAIYEASRGYDYEDDWDGGDEY